VGPTAYVLQRGALDPEGWFCTNNNGDRTEGQVPLALYATQAQAEAEAARREAAAQLGTNPFVFRSLLEGLYGGDDFGLSSHPYAGFRQAIQQLGLRLPDPRRKTTVSPSGHCEFRSAPWLAWWDKHVDAMSEAQRAGIWLLLDQIRFHSVTPVTVED
jgi:hypothetical protein